MKVCKVKKTAFECRMCIDTADFFGQIPNCSKCEECAQEYELISVGTTFFGRDYAMVQTKDGIQRVDLDLVYDIREGRG